MDDLIRALKAAGKLRDEKVGFVQVEGLLQDALKDIQEARAVIEIGERSPFILAYQSMLKVGRALLFLYGYRPVDGAQHKTVIQVSEAILGKQFRSLAEQFESMRRKRNELTYEYGGLLSHSETLQALRDAEEWIRAVVSKVKEKNPQFEFTFD